ncbi:MAG: guanine deaminase, partial [Steroidobacteraceae bacterium]
MAEAHRVPVAAHRGAILHFRGDPDAGGIGTDDAGSCAYFEDGVLLVEDGHIAAMGPAQPLLSTLPSTIPLIDHGEHLLLPGFIDAHIHYPQTDVIGSAGDTLLDWLEHFTYPAERAFADPAHARAVADFFLEELLRNGTTSAMVFGTVHRASIEAFFEAAAARRLRMIAGKALMDRNCPQDLRDSAESGERDSRELLERWAGHGRLEYAITPRFAPASTPEQLRRAGALARAFPGAPIQSHVAENREEVAWARRLFPEARSYLDVYDRVGLVRERAVYAHCIHLDEADRRRMAQAGAAAVFCPSSNLFLGSGLFDIAAADAAGLRFAVATDVGAGTSFSLLRTLGDAYKVAQLAQQRLSPLRAFYL